MRSFAMLSLVCLMVSMTAVFSTTTPVIGILVKPSDIPGEYNSTVYNYLIASYVKWVEAAGARVVPVQFDAGRDQLASIIKNLNGFLFPCGIDVMLAEDGVSPSPYMQAIGDIIDLVIEQNDNGVHFPLVGLGLGSRAIACTFVGRNGGSFNCVKEIDGFFVTPRPIFFYDEGLSTPLLSGVTDDLKKVLSTSAASFFNAKKVVEHSLWEENDGLKENINLYAYALDNNGNEVPSIWGHNRYPIYGIQPLPEKYAYEWSMPNIPHGAESIKVSQIYGHFFISEARKNDNAFGSNAELISQTTINYQPVPLTQFYLDQVYFFKNQQSRAEFAEFLAF